MARLRKFALPAILIVVAFLFPPINAFLESTVDVNLCTRRWSPCTSCWPWA